jgi:flagellar basal body-associated protein FliL
MLGRSSNASNKEEYVDLTLGDPFITNVKDSRSLIKVGVTIRLNNKKAAQELEKNQVRCGI